MTVTRACTLALSAVLIQAGPAAAFGSPPSVASALGTTTTAAKPMHACTTKRTKTAQAKRVVKPFQPTACEQPAQPRFATPSQLSQAIAAAVLSP
jgi:hypothetical protein